MIHFLHWLYHYVLHVPISTYLFSNSIQDILTPPFENEVQDPFGDDVPTAKPPKQVIYKVITKEPPEVDEFGTTKRVIYRLATTPVPHQQGGITNKQNVEFHTVQPIVIPPKNKAKTTTTQAPVTKKPHETPHDPNSYFAVIPYNDITKLFELLNKHTKPAAKGGYKKKSPKKSHKTTTTHKPHKTTTKKPKVIHHVGYGKKKVKQKKKKKKKKVVYVRKSVKLKKGFTFLVFSISEMRQQQFRNLCVFRICYFEYQCDVEFYVHCDGYNHDHRNGRM